VRATGIGENSFLSRMASLVEEARGAKIPIQALADRITLYFVPTVLGLALVSGGARTVTPGLRRGSSLV
ncbi:MAG: hypothetical protein U9R40_02700, partial [Synergistota bacterium]|nr:hypothetical protein [Synergistota bacterium]